MLAPKRTKFRKYQKVKVKKNITDNLTNLQFGRYGLKCCTGGRVSASTIEAVRRCIRRDSLISKGRSIWIRCFPYTVVTTKPSGVRMGKGKGNPNFWVCKVSPGQIIYEMDGISQQVAKKAAQTANSKLPFKTQLIAAQE